VVDAAVLALLFASGLATALGAAPLILVRRLSHRTHDTLLGLAAGIMLGIAGLELLPQSTEHATGSPATTALGIGIGAIAIFGLVRLLRRVPLPMPFVSNGAPLNPGAAFLIFTALAIHNAPEGLATGIGYADGLSPQGHTIALAMALQNVPEGLLVSLAVYAETRSLRAAFGYCLLSGAVEPVAGLVALFALGAVPGGLGIASAFAVGAMVSVVLFQMVPESHRHGYHRAATAALALGLAIAVALDAGLGWAFPQA